MFKPGHGIRSLARLVQYRWLSRTVAVFTEGKTSDAMPHPLTLYGDYASPPVRFVMITALLLKTDLNFHNIDLFKGENKTEAYKEINPLQKVPALKIDDNKVICDSHAIAVYLCYKNESQVLYPKELSAKGQVDDLLFFNATTLFPIDSGIYMDYFAGVWPPKKAKLDNWDEALDYLEKRLKKHHWLCGDKMLLGDICCGLTVSSLGIIVPLTKRHEKVRKWMDELKKLPSFEIDKRGIERFSKYIRAVGPALG